MSNAEKLRDKFKEYVGKPITAKSYEHKMRLPQADGRKKEVLGQMIFVENNDPTVKEMSALAKEFGVTVNFGSFGIANEKQDYIDVKIEQSAAGRFVIADIKIQPPMNV